MFCTWRLSDVYLIGVYIYYYTCERKYVFSIGEGLPSSILTSTILQLSRVQQGAISGYQVAMLDVTRDIYVQDQQGTNSLVQREKLSNGKEEE